MDENRELTPEQPEKELSEQETIQESQEIIQKSESEQQTEQQPDEQVAAEPEAKPLTEADMFAQVQEVFKQAEEQKQEQAPAQPKKIDKNAYRYRWSYREQQAAARKDAKGKRAHLRGMLVYASIITAVFALCFGILIGVLIHDAISPAKPNKDPVQGGFTGDVTVVGGGDEQTIEVSALESVRNYTVVITAKTEKGVGTGTGIVLTEDGYIATNHHVIEDAQTVTVKFYNGQAAVAEVVGYSEIDDIAVIKVEANGLYCATLGSSADIKDAQNVYAVGTPAGEEYAWSVTKGVVSFAQREVRIYDDEGILQKKMKLIQTDTPVNPGNSGGPLVNANGQVLGIITMKLSGQYENMGFAIPIDGAMVLINNIIETGEPGESPITTKRPLIGIVGVGVQAGKYYVSLTDRIQEVDEAYAVKHPDEVFYADHTGVWVQSTTPGLDASNKLQKDDIIVMADGQELATIYDLMEVINRHDGGETVQLTYYRNGVANIVDVTLGYAE